MSIIDDILKGLPDNARLRAFIEEQNSKIEILKSENNHLKNKLKRLEPVGFVESEGLLWKKKSDGTFEKRPYCPHCTNNPIMSQFPPGMTMEWMCSKCDFGADGKIEPPKV
ncbi:hypothetical protein QEH52_19080 [Coraliomargarita sp. SDUM461003]|uniref:Uncharacterized protein n=1 Tax=Thalassobacterium maritimum TaxID=3041265 RepID=A0ABU1AZX3_9BACT|nr:hypothetical protein [Coraliomargarita sp. SDUM461003]MDQ8209631.1 hypothetical protein [Coraliomargarita sp. SDUM461003]